jgi:hypothetical protein
MGNDTRDWQDGAYYKNTVQYMQNYNLTHSFIWVWNLFNLSGKYGLWVFANRVQKSIRT